MQPLHWLWVLSAGCAANEQRRIAHATQPEVAVALELLARKRSHATAVSAIIDSAITELPTASPPDGRRPDTLRRDQRLLEDPGARAKAEQVRRDKWLRILQGLISASLVPHSPGSVLAFNSHSPGSVLALVGAGRRASSLRRRVMVLKAAGRYFMLS